MEKKTESEQNKVSCVSLIWSRKIKQQLFFKKGALSWEIQGQSARQETSKPQSAVQKKEKRGENKIEEKIEFVLFR
jgi:hypothetical protein